MRRISLSVVLLLVLQLYGQNYQEYEDESKDIRLTQKVIVGAKEVARSLNISSLLRPIESVFSSFSSSYKNNNVLANVTYIACVLAPEIREDSNVVSSKLKAHDLDLLHHHMVFIQSHVIELADQQHLESAVPLMLRSVNHMERAMLPAYASADAAAEFCKGNTVLKTFAHLAESLFETQEAIHNCKNKMLVEMLSNFEKVGALASYIEVKKLTKADNYRIEEISKSLEVLAPIFKKAMD